MIIVSAHVIQSAKLNDLPQDREALEAMVRSLILERERESKRANDLQGETLRQTKRAEELYLQNLRLQLELERYKKWYYGPRADRLSSSQDLAQALLEFGEQLQAKPIHPEDVPPKAEPEYELRRVKATSGTTEPSQLRKSSGHNPGLRTECRATTVPRLWRGAQGDGSGRELADRIHSWAL